MYIFIYIYLFQVKIILSAAYGSQRHLPVYRELGLQSDQIFIFGKGGSKKGTPFTKRQGGDYVVSFKDEEAVHIYTYVTTTYVYSVLLKYVFI